MNQERAKHFFTKQIEKNKVSHAYLLVGKSDTFEFAEYMAQTLLCKSEDKKPCGVCSSCLRIKENNHSDFRILGQEDTSIKKDEIISLKTYFNQTSLENSNRKIYVLNDVDLASISALNSILKFLEEPDSDITAILTTSNSNRVLETIQSRCLIIHLESQDQHILYQEAIKMGISKDDAFILSHIESSINSLVLMSETQIYLQAKDIAIDMMSNLNDHKILEAVVLMQHEGIKNKKLDKENIGLFLNILIVLTTHRDNDALLNKWINITSSKILSYKKIFMSIYDRLRPGINTNLLLDQLGYELIELQRRSSI